MADNTNSSLVDVLRARAEAHGDRPLYQRYVDGAVVESLSYAAADARARALATILLQHAQVGDRAVLLYPFGLEYPAVFLACLYAGITAVPAFPPDKRRAVATLPRIAAIIRNADPRLILTTQDLAETVAFVRAEARDPEALQILATDDLGKDPDPSVVEALASRWQRPDRLARELAFLQYTSGSTGTPRGVMIGHDNLYAHQRLAHEKFCQPEGATTVSWLPFYHDMGLIGSLLYPLYHGGTSVLMSPTAFLRRPLSWLHAISSLGAQVSTGPNFAYELCVTRAKDQDLEGLDLSSWTLTVSGAEPLRPATIDRFCARFSGAGFKAQTFMPCFGMAETTLMVSGWPLDRAPHFRSFDKGALLAGRAEPAEDPDGSSARAYVSCGTPMRDHELAIVDPETGARLPEGRDGEIWVRGPSVGRGYWGDPATSVHRFRGRITGEEEHPRWPWFRSADTGFLYAGELYGTGRLADVVAVGTKQHQPHDIECDLSEGPTPLTKEAVLFLGRGEHGEPLACLAAVGRRTSSEPERSALCDRIYERVLEQHGLVLDRVLLIPQRSVAKTTSGKLRRYRYRRAFRDRELQLLWVRRAEPEPTESPVSV